MIIKSEIGGGRQRLNIATITQRVMPMKHKENIRKSILEKKVSRRDALSTAAKIGLAAVVAGVVGGVGGYYAGSMTVPERTVTKTVTKTETVTRAVTTSITTPTVTTTPTTTPKLTEVTMIIRSGPEADYIKEIAKYYNENWTPKTGIKLVLEEYGRHGYFERVVTTLLSKSPKYDLLWTLNMYAGELAEAGVIEPLDDYFADKNCFPYDIENYLPVSLEGSKYKDKIYAIPLWISTMFLYYRTDLIKDPDKLKTWDGFLELAKEFTKQHNPKSPTEFGTCMQAKKGECLPKEFYIYFWSFGGKFFKDGWVPAFNSPEGVEAAEFKVNLLRKWGVVPPDVDTYEYPEVLTALATGKVAFAIQWDAAYYDLKKAWGDKIDILATPAKKGLDPAAFTHTWCMVLNSASKRKKEAFKLAAQLTCDPELSVRLGMSGLPIPTKTVLLNTELLEKNPHWEFMYDFIKNYGHSEIPIPEWPKIHDAVNTYFSLALYGDLTPKRAMDLLNEEVYGTLKAAGYYG